MKYIGCVIVGVAAGYFIGQNYKLEVKVEKENDNG